MLQVLAQHQVVLHLLVEPDGDEAAEVDVGAKAAEKHLAGTQGGELEGADLANGVDPSGGEPGRFDGVEVDVPAQIPARALHADEELVIEHGPIIATQSGKSIRPRGTLPRGNLSEMDNMAAAESPDPLSWSGRPARRSRPRGGEGRWRPAPPPGRA